MNGPRITPEVQRLLGDPHRRSHTARSLAFDCRVSVKTARRALKALEAEGVARKSMRLHVTEDERWSLVVPPR